MSEKVRPLVVIPDPEDLHQRLDRLGDYDYSTGCFVQLWTRTPNATIFYSLAEVNENEGALP